MIIGGNKQKLIRGGMRPIDVIPLSEIVSTMNARDSKMKR